MVRNMGIVVPSKDRAGKTYAMLAIEHRYLDEDIEYILRKLYARHGNLRGVARELGVARMTVSNWMHRFGIPTSETS